MPPIFIMDITMKCNALVVYELRRKKGSGLPYNKIVAVYPIGTLAELIPKEHIEKLSLCNGDVIANIYISEEATWGGTYPYLNIEYCCNVCGNKFYKNLPTDANSLSKFVTANI